MATDTAAPEFDLGPLTWVHGEIDHALARALEALSAFKAAPADQTALKHARAHVHQAAGAIQMVGLDAVSAYTDELERQLARLEELGERDAEPTCDLVDRASRKLKIFLEELVGGASPVPLKLFPEYELMQQARGVKAAVPTDLFYPDLATRAPRIAAAPGVAPQKLGSYLIKQRRAFEQGLLAWLRGEAEGVRQMREAVLHVEDVQKHSAPRAFWWTAGALLEAIVEKGLEPSFGLKQLCGRIGLQIRRFVEGSTKVSDRMRREVLYYVAISAPVGPQVQAVQRAYRLSGLIPSAEVLSADVVRVQPYVREAKDLLASAKDLWLKLTGGRAETLPKLKQVLSALLEKTTAIGVPALAKLAGALGSELEALEGGAVPEPLAMEYATGLLLADSAVESFPAVSQELPAQVDAMVARLEAARQKRPVSGIAAPLLDEMARRAQERLLFAQVAREIQVNLRRMEQALDAFFRDHDKRADLAALAREGKQVMGALQILGLEKAEQLLALCQQQIEEYAKPDTPVVDDDLEMLAEALSGLGFYIEAFEQQRPDRERLIEPLLARRLGAPTKPPAEEHDTLEAAVAELKAALPATLAAFQAAPGDAALRERLAQELTALKNDAELIGDATLHADAAAALGLLSRSGAADTAALQEAIRTVAEGRPHEPAPAPSEEAVRLLETEAAELDAELLDIYLTEADEVLDGMAANAKRLEVQPDDRDALTTVRRGFHTLKGSGRMVGLTELGDIAWELEKIHNRLLEEDRVATPAVLAMIDTALTGFRVWVSTLRRKGRVTPDPKAVRAAIAAVEAEIAPPEHVAPEDELASAAGPDSSVVVGPDSSGRIDIVPASPLAPAAVVVGPDSSGRDIAPASPLAYAVGPDSSGRIDSPTTAAPAEPEIEVLELEESAQEEFPGIDSALAPGETDARGPLAAERREGWGEGAYEVIEFAPAEAESESEAASPREILSDEVTIGDVTLSAALYRILCDEAQQHLATLDAELRALQFDPRATPSQAMVRASHTLCGIHRTGGFPLVAATAKALEQALLGLDERGAPLPSLAQPVLARTVAGLHALTARLRAREPFNRADEAEAAEIAAELEALRQEAAPAAEVEDSESAAVREAAAEETTHRPPAEEEAFIAQLEEEVAGEPGADVLFFEPTAEVIPFEPGVAAAYRHEEAAATGPGAEVLPFEPSAEVIPLAPAGQVIEIPPVSPALEEEEEPLPSAQVIPLLVPAHERAPAQPPVAEAAEERVSEAPAPAPIEPAVAATAAAPVAVEAHGEILAQVRDEVDEQVLPIFLEEAAELFPKASEELRAWRRAADNEEAAHALRRTLHTFKGSARMAGAMRLGELAHLMESRLLAGDGLAKPTPALFETLDTDLDHVAFVLERLQKGEFDAPLPWLAAKPAAPEAEEAPAPAPLAPAALAPEPAAATATATASMTAHADVEAAQLAMLRVRADLIDRLVNEAGEVAIARARVEGELRSLKANLLELTHSVIRLRTQVREIEIQAESQIQSRLSHLKPGEDEFDPLEFDRFTRFQELTRGIAEGVNDVSTVQQALLRNIDEADAALLAQSRLSRDVQQALFSIRTVPFGSVAERLYRIMRQMAKDLDKRANLEIRGTQVELDRSVLEKLVGPLEHLLRNALGHGVEPREERVQRGKPETGEVAITVRQQGNEIAIEVADDGAGLDLERIRDKARAMGLIPDDAEPTEARLMECIFAPGFSTAAAVTQIAGRGVGMDVVRSEIAGLGGRVDVATRRGAGTTFTLYLPLTLAVAQTVLVRAAGRLWALPAPMVEQVQQIKDNDLINLYLTREVTWQDRKYPFFYLPRLLGSPGNNPETLRYNPVVLLRSGQQVAAVHVDEMVGNQEVVVKNIGPQLARVSGIAGATVLGTGEVVLIINPVQLAQRAAVEGEAPMVLRTAQAAKAAAASAPSGPPLVMIVDDSLTVRKITSRFLAREGFEVATAKDGLDALQVLGEKTPDAILLDIEMPRMDGFEFAKTVKSDPKLAHIPIIMITSRTAEKHRNRARELGVEGYLGKPYQEDELLRQLRETLAVHTA